MVNFAELKAKAEKAKDAGIAKVANTRDRYSSVPSSRANWDPDWKRAPPPPPRSRPEAVDAPGEGTRPPMVLRGSRPTDDDAATPPLYTPRPPPTRAASGYPPSHREALPDAESRIDWASLSPEDKEEFFGWLDEFFSRFLGIELGPRKPTMSTVQRTQEGRLAPTVNMATRPSV